MKDLVLYIAKSLVDNPDAVEVSETISPSETVLHLKVGSDDLGQIIGRQGRTARSLRTLISAYSVKEGRPMLLEIES